ncbi:alpha/beta hydrolase [Kribbella jejuensis]|uniref:Pimeloyl-ACP methyl ester carboxylesterase n=1 Tax=Kribbella jejuensis TaxID=236068 RepID=A0A542DTA7_9ACTN|nr:alpha/beta hydrolase [Kribbella jejuensis]TQJ06235.1 pimeloyl-ACP methyl ester carboxylesterase [Kribbella jejuensis]
MSKLMLNAKNLLAAAAGAGILLAGATTAQATESGRAAAQSGQDKPTIVLLHGAYEDGSSWSGVTNRLQHDGYNVLAPAVPLRGIASDTSYLRAVLATVSGPKVLVGHSYGGALVSELADTSGVKSLVYVAAFIPQAGETLGALNSQFPGSELGPDTTNVISYPGGVDLALKPETAGPVLAEDIPAREGAVILAAQRPVAAAAFSEPVEKTAPAALPKYAVIPTGDHAIAPAAERFMATRAGATQIEIPDASHLVAVSQPTAVTQVIERAAR